MKNWNTSEGYLNSMVSLNKVAFLFHEMQWWTFSAYWLYILLIDEDVNGSIDLEELKKCLQKLILTLKEEVEDLFHSCDIDNSTSSMFLEVIYLLVEHSSSPPKSIHLKLDFIFIHMFDLKTSTYCDHPYMMAWGFCFRHQRWVHQSFRPLSIQL